MKKKFLFIFRLVTLSFIILFTFACKSNDPADSPLTLLDRFNLLPGVSAVEIEPYYNFPQAFEIDVTQAVDHNNPDGQKYTQRIYLKHVDESLPMVINTSGYGATVKSGSDLNYFFTSNHISVVHRYCENAKPDPLNWQYLTIKQAAADHHRIIELFKTIYKGKWVSTGRSKGGEAALFHKRFYPEDVQATVAFVAPLVLGILDSRFLDFFETAYDEDCLTIIHQFQRRLLENRDDLLVRFVNWFPDNGYTLTSDTVAEFELAVRWYKWSFWQRHIYDCTEIPDTPASFDEMFAHFAEVINIYNYSDERRENLKPSFYQAVTELGRPAFNTDYLNDLFIGKISLFEDWTKYFESQGIQIDFNPEPILDVIQWLQTKGNNIIYIYGSVDPWTAAAIELTGQTNAIKIIQEGADHQVKISDLDDKELVFDALEEWLEVEILEQEALGISKSLHFNDESYLIPK